jgi:uncharacterized alpha-E superfamily protein
MSMRENPPLLSRVADSVYWMARYMERAENVARFIGVNLNLQLDLPMDRAQQWQPLIDTSGDTHDFKERFGEATQASVIEFLTYDAANSNSIASCLRAARENARSVRETISSEMWAQVNSMYLDMQANRRMPDPGQLTEVFRTIRLGCHLFQGITDATMSHSEPWRILDVKYFILLPSTRAVGTPYDDIHWAAVLKSVSGFGMYRKRHGRILPRDIVDFLLMDPEFPRSIRFCIHCADESLHAITGSPMGSFVYPSEQVMGLLRAELDFTSVDRILRSGLHEYLDSLQEKMNTVDSSILNDFVTRPPLTQAAGAHAAD